MNDFKISISKETLHIFIMLICAIFLWAVIYVIATSPSKGVCDNCGIDSTLHKYEDVNGTHWYCEDCYKWREFL